MKQVLVWFCLFAVVRMENLDSSSEEEASVKPEQHVRIDRIRTSGDLSLLENYVVINEERNCFDIYVKLKRKLGSNYLILNTNLRAKLEDADRYIKMIDMKRVDFCAFLKNPAYQEFFINSMVEGIILQCPVQVGNYSIRNVNLNAVIRPNDVPRGTYKFFSEIVEVTGDTPKVFAIQLTTTVA